MRVLVIEDSLHARKYVTMGLKKSGYAVDTASDGEEGQWLIQNHDFDVIVLDLMLPKIDGIRLLENMRASGNKSHVLIVTAKTSVEDRVQGLQKGADDYLTKPFALSELLARVQALVRRKFDLKTESLTVGELTINTSLRNVTKAGQIVDLRPREYSLMEYMALNLGKTVSRTEIESHVYDFAKDIMSNVVDSSICLLRKKIDAPGRASYIRTVHRRGYILGDPDQ